MWFQAWHWLVIHNLWQSVIGWAVITFGTAAVAWRPWRKHRTVQRAIADRLDSSTPGGITDLIQAVKGGDDHEADS